MSTLATPWLPDTDHAVAVHVEPPTGRRNRLTTAFRLFLAIPHVLLVGGPIAGALSWTWQNEGANRYELGSTGVLGAAAAVSAVIAWFAIVLTGRHPDGLWNLGAFYLRWRVRAVAYAALLRDEYPPFGDGPYGAMLSLRAQRNPRDRVGVAFRLILVIPQLIAVWALGVAWGITTVIAWFAILFTGQYPETLYRFGVGVLRWSTRVEAYLLLLHDDYPPFSLS
jgi:hypothetical protein